MINNPLEVHYNEKRDMFYVKQGNSTFYNLRTRQWIMFKTTIEAQAWIDGYMYRDDMYNDMMAFRQNLEEKRKETASGKKG